MCEKKRMAAAVAAVDRVLFVGPAGTVVGAVAVGVVGAAVVEVAVCLVRVLGSDADSDFDVDLVHSVPGYLLRVGIRSVLDCDVVHVRHDLVLDLVDC